MNEPILRVFFILWCTLVALSIVDSLGDWLFWPFVHGFGLRVIAQEVPMLQPSLTPIGTVFETANGKFKVVDPDVTLARQRYGWMRSRTQVRARIIWRGDVALFESRISWITVISPLAILGFVLATGLACTWEALAVIAVFAFGVTGLEAFMSRRQALALMEEYRARRVSAHGLRR